MERVEQSGIIFLDEIDKIVGSDGAQGRMYPGRGSAGSSADRGRFECQHRYGMVKTDHILFIAAGAFSASKPSDLIPELQGGFPSGLNWIRWEKRNLSGS